MRKQAILALVLSSFSTLIAATPAFQGLGHLWEYDKNSSAYAVSTDGSTIVGMSEGEGGGPRAVMWNNNQMQVLGDSRSIAFDVTSDGSIAVGVYGYDYASYWTDGAMTTLPIIGTNNNALGVSADGSIIVGDNSGSHPVVWRNGTPSILDDLPGGTDFGTAHAVSDDGMTAVGWSDSSFEHEAVYWNTQDSSVHRLGYLVESHLGQRASNISPDGTMIVGYEGYSHYDEAFFWMDGEMIGLGRLDPKDSNRSHAFAVSNNGIVVGMAEIDGHDNAFIWDDLLGMRELKQVLTDDYDLDLTGWQLTEAYDISADGSVIVGGGLNPDGHSEAWVATIPEPCTILLLGLGGFLIRKRQLTFGGQV